MNQTAQASPVAPPETVGRYVLHTPIARGGMATVHAARLVGAEGFSRLVAAKRLHPQFTDDPEFVAMFHDEARIASMIHHPNVVPVLDVVLSDHEVILVQEYVHGVPLSVLMRKAIASETPIPVEMVVAILSGVLSGLHAAHEAKDELNEPLHIIHRDVSPQNVMVSIDGVPRLLDFGIAKARTSSHHTRDGFFKGKLSYMAPEQLRLEAVSRTVDVYATGVLMWELLTNRKFNTEQSDADFVAMIMNGPIPSVTATLKGSRARLGETHWRNVAALESIVARALSRFSDHRFPTAADMLDALLRACAPASSSSLSEWVKESAADHLEQRQQLLAANEEHWRSHSRDSFSMRHPSSGVQLIHVQVQDPITGSSSSSSLSPPVATSMFDQVQPRSMAARLVPWTLTGGLLLVVGALLGVRQAPGQVLGQGPGLLPGVVQQGAVRASAAMVAEAPVTIQPSQPTATANEMVQAPALSLPNVVAKPNRPEPKAPTPSRAQPQRNTSAPRSTEPKSPAGASSASQTSAASPQRNDCETPFYFDGAKKLFKPTCL